jgi:hypothetical protein
MATFTYPPDKAKEVGKSFLSGNAYKFPDFVTRENVFVVLDAEVKNYVIYEVKDEKAHEGLIAIANRFTRYFDIEGTRFKIEHLLTTKEALPLIGLD